MTTLHEPSKLTKKWVISKYTSDAAFQAGEVFETSVFEENVLLSEGITEALKLIGGITATAFSNANAYLGVGDSSTAESAAHTGLQATTNKLYKAMEAGYPQVSGSTITWRSIFGGTDANFAWNEFTVANGNSDASVNLNRKVSTQGTKASGQTWTLDLTLTLS